MEINTNASSALTQSTVSSNVAIAVLKKSIDAEAQGALALISSLPQPQGAANLPPNLGQNINVTA